MLLGKSCLLSLVAVENVFKIGSMEPGAMLYDASKEFEVDILKAFYRPLTIVERHAL